MFASNCQMLQRGNTHGEKEWEWEQVKKFGKMFVIGEYRWGYISVYYTILHIKLTVEETVN